MLNGKDLTPEMREKMMGLQKNLKDGRLRLGGSGVGANIEELLASGAFDRTMLAKALLVQKILADSGTESIFNLVNLTFCSTDFLAYSDTLGNARKCHYKQGFTVTSHFLLFTVR